MVIVEHKKPHRFHTYKTKVLNVKPSQVKIVKQTTGIRRTVVKQKADHRPICFDFEAVDSEYSVEVRNSCQSYARHR